MDLRVLKYFLTVAREGSITKATNILHVTQPTISRQLMDLEAEIGHKLFKRSSHNIKLTDAGILLKKRAEEILDMAERIRSEFSQGDEEIIGDVYIGSGETYAMKEIAGVVRKLKKKYPHIRYHLFSGNADDVTEKLDRKLIDFGLLIQPADLSKYDHLTLSQKDRWGLLMRRDNPLSRKSCIHRKDLLGIPLLVSRQVMNRSGGKNELKEWLGTDLEKCDIAATYNLIYNVSILVREGVGCALSLDKLSDTSKDSELCFKPLSPRVESTLNIVWEKGRNFSEAANKFLEELRNNLSYK